MLNQSDFEFDASHIDNLNKCFSTFDTDIAISISYVRRAQGLSFRELENRMTGINSSTLKRYLQPSYSSVRPLHVVAALSWVMMVPMTSFYAALKLKESYRGMDDYAVKALHCVGRLPDDQFKLYIDLISGMMTDSARTAFQRYRKEIEAPLDSAIRYDSLFPPEPLNIDTFAIDYYRSVAITLKRFRSKHSIPEKALAKLLGLSMHQYRQLEDETKPRDFTAAIGFRMKLAFQLYSHVNFTSEMTQYSQFHQLRKVQHIRDSLVVEAFRQLNDTCKDHAVQILLSLSSVYIKNLIQSK